LTVLDANHQELGFVGKSDAVSTNQSLSRFESEAYEFYSLGSPRTDLLLKLIKYNVFRALLMNNSSLGFASEWLEADTRSPFLQSQDAITSLVHSSPTHLQPTLLQQTVEHHPWIDLLPLAEMRDNILQAGEEYDDGPLCYDILDHCQKPGGEAALIVWGQPWDPDSWEVTEEFKNKWPWVLKGCWRLFQATNKWRAMRAEPKLFPDAVCFPVQQ
jgi:hypothetical protein